MSFKLGNTSIGELYVGSNKIGSAYLGSTKVFEGSAPTPPGPSFDSVTIGTQTWMSKNLAIDDGGEGITIVDNVTANGVNFGTQYYYTWDAAIRVSNSIQGWHLSSKAEWDTLKNYIGSSVAGGKLASTSGWNNNGNGTDDYGFTALPAGFYSGGMINVGSQALFWTSTEAYRMYLIAQYNALGSQNTNKSFRHTLRLVKD